MKETIVIMNWSLERGDVKRRRGGHEGAGAVAAWRGDAGSTGIGKEVRKPAIVPRQAASADSRCGENALDISAKVARFAFTGDHVVVTSSGTLSSQEVPKHGLHDGRIHWCVLD